MTRPADYTRAVENFGLGPIPAEDLGRIGFVNAGQTPPTPGDEIRTALAPVPSHCPGCGMELPLRDLLRPIIRETIVELEAQLNDADTEPAQPPEEPKPPNPLNAPVDSQGKPLY